MNNIDDLEYKVLHSGYMDLLRLYLFEDVLVKLDIYTGDFASRTSGFV